MKNSDIDVRVEIDLDAVKTAEAVAAKREGEIRRAAAAAGMAKKRVKKAARRRADHQPE